MSDLGEYGGELIRRCLLVDIATARALLEWPRRPSLQPGPPRWEDLSGVPGSEAPLPVKWGGAPPSGAHSDPVLRQYKPWLQDVDTAALPDYATSAGLGWQR